MNNMENPRYWIYQKLGEFIEDQSRRKDMLIPTAKSLDILKLFGVEMQHRSFLNTLPLFVFAIDIPIFVIVCLKYAIC